MRDKLLHLDSFRSLVRGEYDLVWDDHGSLWTTFVHLFFMMWISWYSVFSVNFSYVWPSDFPFLMTYYGSEKKSSVNTMRFRLATRSARMCNGRCLHSSMIGIVRTASKGPSRTVQTGLRCPRPESFSLTSQWTGRMLCFVANLVAKCVGLGGSQFSESILDNAISHFASQQNVAIQECGSPCSLHSALFSRNLTDERNVFDNRLTHYLSDRLQRVAPFHHVSQLLHEQKVFWPTSWERVVFLPLEAFFGSVRTTECPVQPVPTTGCPVLWIWSWLVWLGTFRLLLNLSLWSLGIFWTQFTLLVMF